MKKTENRNNIIDEAATEFVLDVINSAMLKYGVPFEAVDSALIKLGLWDLFNDSEVTCAGAHNGNDAVVMKIGERI